jgi:amino acid transporter
MSTAGRGSRVQPDPSQGSGGQLGLLDTIFIIVGIVIGSTIFFTPPEIFHDVGNHWIALGMWVVGGLLAFIGALCYAELATAYPRLGGDYNYLTRAYGPLAGYLFGWAQLAVVQTASVGMMAFVFADYTNRLAQSTAWWTLESPTVLGINLPPTIIYAAGAVAVLTLLNLLGVVLGKAAQNLLSVIKLLGLIAIIVAGFGFAGGSPQEPRDVFVGQVVSTSKTQIVVRGLEEGEQERTFTVATPDTRVTIKRRDEGDDGKNTVLHLKQGQTVRVFTKPGAGEAEPAVQVKAVNLFEWANLLALIAGPMVLIMLAYGGWNDAAFVAAEVRDRDRNLPRALLGGTALIALIYVLVNGAYLFGLGVEGAEEADQIAADTLKLLPGPVGELGERAMTILVMISALAAVNGLIYTSSRIYSTLGSDYSLFAPLGTWSRALGTPVWALLLQMVITLLMLVMVGTDWGRGIINDGLVYLGFEPVTAWYVGGFFPLLQCSAPIFWLFFLMAGLSLFVLRVNEPHVERPFRVPLFPLVPLLFCATCGYMLYSGIRFAGQLGLVGAVLVLVGLPFYIFSRRSRPAAGAAVPPSAPPSDKITFKF